MKVLVCCVGGLGDAVALLPTLDALNDGLDQADISVLCPPRLAGLLTMTIPGIRPIPVDRAVVSGLTGSFRLPALAAQIGRVDVALMAPYQGKLLHSLVRKVAPQVIGFACGSPAEQKSLTVPLPYDPARSVPDSLCDLARLLLDWPGMPLQRVAPLPRELFQGEEDPYGVIHVGAGTALQRWNQDLFGDVAHALADHYGFPWRTVSDDDAYDLIELAALLAGAQGFVGCHSGPLQLAAAQGVPWVAVAGPTPQAWDPPWRDVPGTVLRLGLDCQPCGTPGVPLAPCPHHGHCLAALTVDDVLKAAYHIIPQAIPSPAW